MQVYYIFMEMEQRPYVCRSLLLLGKVPSGRVVLAQAGGGQPALFLLESPQVGLVLCSVITAGRLFVPLAEGTQVFPVLLLSSSDSSAAARGEGKAPRPVT